MRPKKPLANQSIDGVIRPQASKRHRRFTKRTLIAITVVLVSVAVLTITIIIRNQDRNTAVSSELSEVTNAVGRHFQLPANEEPAVATIVDSTKVSSAFKSAAQNGDKVLVYQKNAMAILYRPSIDRIVAVVPVSIDTPKGGVTVQ